MRQKRRPSMVILVTGAAGMLGSSFVHALVSRGEKVRALLLPNTWHPLLDGVDLEIVHGDVLDIASVRKAMRGCTQVYHMVGIVSYQRRDAALVKRVNVDGTRNVLIVAGEQKTRVVVTASTAGIGISDGIELLHEDTIFPARYRNVAYMHSKHMVLEECKRFAANGVTVCAVSPTTIYGQGDMGMHIGKLVRKIKDDAVWFIPPGGNAVVSVDDTISAHLLAMAKGKPGENYLIANECLPYREIYAAIAEVLEVRVTQRVFPAWVQPIGEVIFTVVEQCCALFGGETLWPTHAWNSSFRFRYFDATKARRELGWRPKENFRSAMRKAIAFYRTQRLL